MSKAADTDFEKWKRKYFDSLRELEDKEKQWEKIEALLRKIISRLSIIAEVSSEPLQQKISLLRESIRNGTEINRLELLINEISESIENSVVISHEKPQTDIQDKHSISSALNTILDSIIIGEAQAKQVKKFKKYLNKNKNVADDEYISEFSVLLSELIDSEQATDKLYTEDIKNTMQQFVERRSDNRSVGKLDEDIDRSLEPKKNTLLAPAVGELLLQLISRFPPALAKKIEQKKLSRQASSSRSRKDLMKVVDSISQIISVHLRQTSTKTKNGDGDGALIINGEVLIHLLERISLPDDLMEQAVSIKQTVENGINNEQLAKQVEATADLIMVIRSRIQVEKQELEQFLKQIADHLKDLDIDIQVTSRLRDESQQGLKKFEQDLQDGVQGIELDMTAKHDLSELKVALESRVKTLRLHMGVFRKAEEDRYTRAQQTIENLKSRLSDMTAETQTLREQVQHEHQTAVRDALTGIPNRLAYEERIEADIARCLRYQKNMAFLLWDVDHFKGINDHYGHQAGDKVLAVIAELLQKSIRAADFIARYGGEEFIVLMPEADVDMAIKGAEKLRLAIENCNFHYRDTSVPITASCGITIFQAQDSVSSIFVRADKALYQAKDEGRNRCVMIASD